MKILATTDVSREGNDCYIYESVSLVEQFGVYAVVICQKVVGWPDSEDIFIKQVTSDRAIAFKMYEDYSKPL